MCALKSFPKTRDALRTSFPSVFSATKMSSPKVSRSAIFENRNSGSGLHELSVTRKSLHFTPTLDASAVSSGTYSAFRDGDVLCV